MTFPSCISGSFHAMAIQYAPMDVTCKSFGSSGSSITMILEITIVTTMLKT